MSELFLKDRVTLHCGDCREVLVGLPKNSIDACVTDPPYHLVSVVKRFGNGEPEHTKTYADMMGRKTPIARLARGFMGKQWDGGDIAFRPETWAAVYRVLKPGAHLLAFGGTRTYGRMQIAIEDAGFEVRDTIGWLFGSGFPKSHNIGNGWGTALKPAMELICLARKPISESTVAANVLKWGTGAINVDECRIATDPTVDDPRLGGKGDWERGKIAQNVYGKGWAGGRGSSSVLGRWPANVIHDGSEQVIATFPETQSGMLEQHHQRTGKSQIGTFDIRDRTGEPIQTFGDSGSAARFFYTAKADGDDRLGSKHPTVKPLDLMQYLCRLVTPLKGTIIDPFSGTGTTGEAAFREGFNAILIEREEEYQRDIRRRMELVLAGPDERARESIKARGLTDSPGPLFDALDS